MSVTMHRLNHQTTSEYKVHALYHVVALSHSDLLLVYKMFVEQLTRMRYGTLQLGLDIQSLFSFMPLTNQQQTMKIYPKL